MDGRIPRALPSQPLSQSLARTHLAFSTQLPVAHMQGRVRKEGMSVRLAKEGM